MSKRRKKKHATATPPPVRRPAQPAGSKPVAPTAPPPMNRPTRNYKTIALAVAMTVALGVGAWLAISPTLEKQRMLDRQAELLTSITAGDGVIVLDDRFAADEVDFYDGGAAAPQEEAAMLRPVMYTVTTLEADAETPTETEAPSPEKTVVTGTGVLSIDSIDLKLPVTDGVTTSQLKVAVGHVPQTAPIGGVGNAVIAGHRSYTYGQHFNRLGEVIVGDTIHYEDRSGAAFTYEVFEILEVLPGDNRAFQQPVDERMLTLYTCTPVRTATHRLLVRARLINQVTIEEESH